MAGEAEKFGEEALKALIGGGIGTSIFGLAGSGIFALATQDQCPFSTSLRPCTPTLDTPFGTLTSAGQAAAVLGVPIAVLTLLVCAGLLIAKAVASASN